VDSKAPDAFRTISEVAADISVPQHVLRFWESRFREIRPMKRGGGRRYYRPDDIDLLRGIRHLLYGEGYTIKGVQRILKEQGLRFVQTVWQPGAPRPAHRPADEADATDEAEAGHDGSERGRGLFSLLPSLIGNVDEEDEEEEDDDDGEEPTVLPGSHQEARALAPSRTVPPVNGAAARPVPADQARKLQTALKELAECRKLIDAALEDKS
jgi:DNA-binding transcriptional MerR regulator